MVIAFESFVMEPKLVLDFVCSVYIVGDDPSILLVVSHDLRYLNLVVQRD